MEKDKHEDTPHGEAFNEMLHRAMTAAESGETGEASAAPKAAAEGRDNHEAKAGNADSRAESSETKAEQQRRRDRRRLNAREEQARRAFRRLTDIDDEGGVNLSLRSLLGGDMLGSKRFRKQLWYLLLLSVMAVVYVSNRYACQHELIRQQSLKEKLTDRQFKALTIASELTEYSMRSNVERHLSDTTLQMSTRSAYYLPVDTTAAE